MNENVEQWHVRKAVASSSAGAVAAQHWLAARAGAHVLHEGGNAVDAAVATACALGVVEPWMSGFGGAGYMVVWLARDQRAFVVDFQGMLPAAISGDDYPLDPAVPASIMGFPGVRDERNIRGYGSILVPGTLAGLASALDRWGRFPLDRVMGPSLRLLELGLPVDWHTTLMIALEARKLSADPAARAWFLPHGLPALPEQLLANPALRDTYRTIARDGPGAMYGGAIGAAMADDLQVGGSKITLDDLAAYEVDIADATAVNHRGHCVYTAGPSSGGLRLADALAHAEAHLDPTAGLGPATWRAYAAALDHAFARHKVRLGRKPPEHGCTTHLSVVDGAGNMVALTNTLLNRFGSGVVLPQSGLLMNNSVSYFDPRPGLPTSMRGRLKINASNMCPTVAVRDGEARFAVGASGANHIVPCVFQLVALMLDYGLDLEAAFHTPRLDASDRGSIRIDPRLDAAQLAESREVESAQQLVFPKLYGCPSGVARDPATGACCGIADVSSPIAAAAPPAPFAIAAGPANRERRA